MAQVITEQGDLGLGVFDYPDQPLNESEKEEKDEKDFLFFCNLYEKNKIHSFTVFILGKMLKVELVSSKKYVIIKKKSGSSLKM